MEIVIRILRSGDPVAAATYRPGFLVEPKVTRKFNKEKIDIPLSHSENDPLKGNWEEALDNYFNHGEFDSKDSVFPGEIRRIGHARDHKSLFRQAAVALRKDLAPLGYEVLIEYP